MDANALTQLEVQVAIPLLVGLTSVGLAYLRKRLNLQADSTAAQLDTVANSAIQNAVANFAGKVSGALTAGTLTHTNAVAQLRSYLAETVADSVARLPMSDTALDTVLRGKLAALPKVVAPVQPERDGRVTGALGIAPNLPTAAQPLQPFSAEATRALR